MTTKYIVDNLAEQTIGGSLSAITLSADTLYVSGNSVIKPYKVYTALLTQTGTSAPVATVLENTLGGEVVWSYNSDGDYTATLNGAFPDEYKFYTTPLTLLSQTRRMGIYWIDNNSFSVSTIEYAFYNGFATNSNNFLLNQPIEIRIYN